MIRLAWSRLRYRPARGLLVALPATALGVLAERSLLYGLACALYIFAAAFADDGRAGLSTLSSLGWPRIWLFGAVLAEYGLAALGAGILAAPLAAIAGTADAVTAFSIAFALALSAGAGRAAERTVRLDQDG